MTMARALITVPSGQNTWIRMERLRDSMQDRPFRLPVQRARGAEFRCASRNPCHLGRYTATRRRPGLASAGQAPGWGVPVPRKALKLEQMLLGG
jgi:hypothetical protein